MIRIIGIGSPFGGDAVGLRAAEILAADPPSNCEVVSADRPGAELIELMDGADAVILIDAVRSGAPPGTIHVLEFDELEGASARFVSSHDLGVAAAIQLARKLDRAPSRGWIVGLEIAPDELNKIEQFDCGSDTAIDELVARVRSCAKALYHR
ncbi:MAG TPA: hydrogenase maturation protease [Candidatus Binataceae bacterium]|nr:hydrogenase maturation protease [Candidatus Binataceae bacterium]